MPEPDTAVAAHFLRKWADYTLALGAAEQQVLQDLSNAPAARQQVQFIFQTALANEPLRREVALRMALAELPLFLEHG